MCNVYPHHSVGTQTNNWCTHVKELITDCCTLDTTWVGIYDFRSVGLDMNVSI